MDAAVPGGFLAARTTTATRVGLSDNLNVLRAANWYKTQKTAQTLAFVFLSLALVAWLSSFIWFIVDAFKDDDETIACDQKSMTCNCKKLLQKKLMGPMILFFVGAGLLLILIISVLVVYGKHGSYAAKLATMAHKKLESSVLGQGGA